MIQDIGSGHLQNQYQPRNPQPEDRVLAFRERTIYLKETAGQMQYLTYRELGEACRKMGRAEPGCQYLFSIGETAYYLASLDGMEFPGFAYRKMFDIRRMNPRAEVFAGATGWHLYTWYHANRFCGCCGTPMVHDGKERMLRCPSCGNMAFPKISPAVIVGVTNGDKILMTKYAGREFKRYALIAGFTEIGETVEETVAREVMEEVGLHVKNIRYYKSQPWGFEGDLLLGFFAELDDDAEITMDETELSVAEWVRWQDIPEDFEKLSLTSEMMQVFKRNRAKDAQSRADWQSKYVG